MTNSRREASSSPSAADVGAQGETAARAVGAETGAILSEAQAGGDGQREFTVRMQCDRGFDDTWIEHPA